MYGKCLVCAIAVMSLTSPWCSAATWQLNPDEQWVEAENQQNSEYLMAVANIKQLVFTGKVEKAGKAFAGLRESFPEIAGEVRYLADGRTNVLPVRLYPGRRYAIWFNSPNHTHNAFAMLRASWRSVLFHESVMMRNRRGSRT